MNRYSLNFGLPIGLWTKQGQCWPRHGRWTYEGRSCCTLPQVLIACVCLCFGSASIWYQDLCTPHIQQPIRCSSTLTLSRAVASRWVGTPEHHRRLGFSNRPQTRTGPYSANNNLCSPLHKGTADQRSWLHYHLCNPKVFLSEGL